MALLTVFLAYSFLMFQAGYQWCKWGRKWTGKGHVTHTGRPADSSATWDGMIGKI